MRGHACAVSTVIQSYIHARLKQLGCAVVHAVVRSGFRDTGLGCI